MTEKPDTTAVPLTAEVQSILDTIDNQVAERETGCLSMHGERLLANALRAAPAPASSEERVRELAVKLADVIDNTEVNQSTKNANASFIDTRDWQAILSTVIELKAALAAAGGEK